MSHWEMTEVLRAERCTVSTVKRYRHSAWDPTYLSGIGLHWHWIGYCMHAERYIEMQRGYLFDELLVVCEYTFMYCIV